MSPQKINELGSENLFDSIYTLSLNAISDAVVQSIRATAVELYKSLEQASDWLRADYSIAINLLEANDEWFAARVCASVKYAYKHDEPVTDNLGTSSKSTEGLNRSDLKKISSSSLSLVSKDEFEDWLTANVAVKYLEAELGYELHEVRLILGFLSRTSYDTKDCPLSPNILFRSLKASIDVLEIPTAPQALIYKLFSRQLIQPLRAQYKSIISIIQKAELVYKPLIAPPPSSKHHSNDNNYPSDATYTKYS